MEPPVLIEGCPRLLGIFEVANEHVRPPKTNLAASFARDPASPTTSRVAPVPRVRVEVAHLGDVLQAYLRAGHWPANMIGREITQLCQCYSGRRLGLPIAFNNIAAEQYPHEREHIGRNWGASCHHQPHLIHSQRALDFIEDQFVPQRMGQTPLFQPLDFGPARPHEQLRLKSARCQHPVGHLVINPVQHSRHGRHYLRPQRGDIAHKFQRVSPEKPNRRASREDPDLHHTLVDVRKGQIGDVRVLLRAVEYTGR
mmetsp:Transcript_1212/g.1894  ORF Transcript_1212/g.1894 Transcript_1212/m.1894 type:complete len:255 (+) Transcript_1212:521-1285(+)